MLSCWFSPALLLGIHWGEEWAVSPSRCHHETCTRDGNKVSGSATARPLEADRQHFVLLQSALHCLFTRKERRSVSIMICYMSSCQLFLLCKLTILSEIAVALLFVFCLNLKSGFVKRIFPTSMLVVSLLREKFQYLTLNLNVSCDLILNSRTFWNITSCTGILSFFLINFSIFFSFSFYTPLEKTWLCLVRGEKVLMKFFYNFDH